MFKQGTSFDAVAPSQPDDIERASVQTAQEAEQAAVEYEKALNDTPTSTDIFSWQNLSYTVPVAEGTRQLLNEVSGFVAPGKLTALMGESGAGKVHRPLLVVVTQMLTAQLRLLS